MLGEKAFIRRLRTSARGFTLIETLLAIGLLAVGVMGLATLIPFAARNDYRARIDTTATFLATQQLEQMLAQPWTAATPECPTPPPACYLAAADGNGFPAIVFLTDADVTDTTGTGAALDPATGTIDFDQDPALVPDGYRRVYTIAQSLDDTAPKVNYGTYDIRWNVYESGATGIRTIVIAARPVGDLPGTTNLPANLRVVRMK